MKALDRAPDAFLADVRIIGSGQDTENLMASRDKAINQQALTAN